MDKPFMICHKDPMFQRKGHDTTVQAFGRNGNLLGEKEMPLEEYKRRLRNNERPSKFLFDFMIQDSHV